jgi:uncharacterized protein (DUF433 family)
MELEDSAFSVPQKLAVTNQPNSLTLGVYLSVTQLGISKLFRTHMTALQEAENLLPGMTRAEKAQLLQAVINDLGDAFPGIESQPGVCGGEPCIIRTRIPVWVLEQARRLGTSEADLLRIYPTLRAEDIVHAWAYVRAHRSEIDLQIRNNEEA